MDTHSATDFDLIVVGARCAGATMAALAARAGLRVLLVDQVTFPSFTLSTHTMHADALAVLDGAGVLPEVEAVGAPRIEEVVCDYGDFQIVGPPPPVDGIDHGLCIPRYRLDAILVRHAGRCGARVATDSRVSGLLISDGAVRGVTIRSGGRTTSVTAPLVVGADGRLSTVASRAGASYRHRQRSGWYLWYGYFAGVPAREPSAYELYFEQASFAYVFPTTDGLHLIGGEFAFKEHPRRHGEDLLRLLRDCPRLWQRMGDARLVEGPYGMFRIDSFMRDASGSGWALVGDASFFKDPCTGQGMFDAFRGAQLLAQRIVEGWALAGDPLHRLDAYPEDREREFGEWYRFTCRAAQAVPVSPERRRFLRLIAEDPSLTAEYLGIQNHTIRPSALFNLRRLKAVAATA
jgi:menaquinone-9 beta-reductase